jgi:hypothetical protein
LYYTKIILLTLLLTLLFFNIISSLQPYSYDQYIRYKILLPDGSIIYKKTNICETCMIVLNKTIYVHIIYDKVFFTGYNISKQHTELKITIGGELRTYNTIHVFYRNKTYAYELYYEVNSRILLYGIITNMLTGEEYDIILSSSLRSLTWSLNTTRSNTSETTIKTSTASNIIGTNTTASSRSKTSEARDIYGSTNMFITILLLLVIVLIVLFMVFNIMRRGHGRE